MNDWTSTKDSQANPGTPQEARLRQLKDRASRNLALGLFDQAANILYTVLQLTEFADEEALNTCAEILRLKNDAPAFHDLWRRAALHAFLRGADAALLKSALQAALEQPSTSARGESEFRFDPLCATLLAQAAKRHPLAAAQLTTKAPATPVRIGFVMERFETNNPQLVLLDTALQQAKDDKYSFSIFSFAEFYREGSEPARLEEFLSALRERGVKTILASNTDSPLGAIEEMAAAFRADAIDLLLINSQELLPNWQYLLTLHQVPLQVMDERAALCSVPGIDFSLLSKEQVLFSTHRPVLFDSSDSGGFLAKLDLLLPTPSPAAPAVSAPAPGGAAETPPASAENKRPTLDPVPPLPEPEEAVVQTEQIQPPSVLPLEAAADQPADLLTPQITSDNPAELMETALAQLAQGNYDSALTMFERVLTLHPEMHSLRYGKALALSKLGRMADAKAVLAELLVQSPTHQKALQLLAELEKLPAEAAPEKDPLPNLTAAAPESEAPAQPEAEPPAHEHLPNKPQDLSATLDFSPPGADTPPGADSNPVARAPDLTPFRAPELPPADPVAASNPGAELSEAATPEPPSVNLAGDDGDLLVDRAICELQRKNIEGSLHYLATAGAAAQPVRDLAYVKGLCFIALKDYSSARRALSEELKNFPDNNAAKDVFAKLSKTA